MTLRVSVVMPARNAARHIGAAVSSALAQTIEDLEVVVVDDGSTDATAAIAESHGKRVRVVSQASAGVAAARNRGIAESRAALVAFCDADDILLPGHLAALLSVHGGGRAVATANAYWLFETGIDPARLRHRGRFPPESGQRRAILEQNFVSTMAVFPRTLVDEIGPFSEDLTRAEDWEFWMRAVFAGVPVRHQPRPLALYRWGDGLSADRAGMHAAVLQVLRRADERLPLTPDERGYVRLRLDGPSPQQLARQGDEALAAGRWAVAARSYRAAAALLPSETPLVRKAGLLRVAPPLTGRALRWRRRRATARRGWDLPGMR